MAHVIMIPSDIVNHKQSKFICMNFIALSLHNN